MAKKRKYGSRKRTIPLIGGILALIGSGMYAVRRRRNSKAE